MAFGSFMYDARATVAGWNLHRRSWRQNAYLGEDEVESYQYERLRALLIDASRHVPYYRQQFASLGFDPEQDFRQCGNLSKLPILTKQDVRDHADRLRRTHLPQGAILEHTSGSTGQPLSVWISPRQIAVEKATVWRHWQWNGYRFHDPVAIVRTYVPQDGQPLWRYDRARNFLYFSAYHLDDSNARSFLDHIARFKPGFLRGYPSSLAILADVAERFGYDPPALHAILTASETLTDTVREKLQRVFKARVSDWYGLAEQVVTAAQCPETDGLHRHDDYGYWELIPLADGTDRCRIIGTNLHNTAMPLIRYDTGDLAIGQAPSPCACGRTLPRIGAIAGRADDDLVDPSGRRIPSVNFYSVFRQYGGIRRFQMVQERVDCVDVRVETDQLSPEDAASLHAELTARLGQGIAIRLQRNVPFERNPHGKRRAVISRVARQEEVPA